MKTQALKECDCEGWKISSPQILSAQSLAWAHGQEYTGYQFTYCPFCGKKREEQIDKNDILDTTKKYPPCPFCRQPHTPDIRCADFKVPCYDCGILLFPRQGYTRVIDRKDKEPELIKPLCDDCNNKRDIQERQIKEVN